MKRSLKVGHTPTPKSHRVKHPMLLLVLILYLASVAAAYLHMLFTEG